MTVTHSRFDFARVLPLLVLLLLPCLLLWRVVFLHEAFLPADLLRDVAPWRPVSAPASVPWVPLQWDGIAEFYPWRLFAARTLHQGFLPLWDPYQFCGTPFVANSQSAVFYPLNLLFVLLPVPTAFGVSALLHLMLTGLLMYGFLRSPALGLGRAAATLGAVVWQMSAWQAAWLVLPTFLCVSAWLPLALWRADRLAARPTAARGAALGVCLGVMLLGGHLQIALYCLLLVAAYGLFRAYPVMRGNKALRLPVAGASLLAVALMAAIAAPQALPTLELSHVSHRAGAPLTWSSYGGYTALATPAINLVTLFLPGFFGNPTQGTYWGIGTNGGPGAYMENACYIGILALLLAVTAIALTWRGRLATRFFAITAIVALLMALGTPLDALLFFGLPGFAQSGSPGRILVVWTFCGATLAAIGLQGLQQRLDAVGKALGWSVGAFLLLLGLSLAGTVEWIARTAPAGTLQANLGHEGDLWRLPAGILLGAAAVFALRQRGTVSPRALAGLLVALAALDLLAVNLGFNRTAPVGSVYPVTPAIAFLQQRAGNGRIMPLNRSWSLFQPPAAVLPPNAALVYGLRDTQGYDSLLTRQYMDWAGRLDAGPPAPPENGNMVFTYGFASPQAAEAGAKYLVSLGPLPDGNAGVKLALQDGETYVYENAAALPRARALDNRGIVALNDIAPTRLQLTVEDSESSGVTVADQWYPGWRAWVNGQERPIYEEPEIFRTVCWPQAQTANRPVTITMRYLPTSFRLGLYGLCAALGILCAIGSHAALTRRLGRRRFGRG